MRDNFDPYQQAGVRVFGVNPASVKSHDSFVELFGFPFPLISDPGSAIAKAYGAIKDNGTSIQRSVFLVHDGAVRWSKEGAPPTDEILAELAPTQ